MKEVAVELVGIGLYLLVMQHCLAVFVFEKPEESWLQQGWRWLATRHDHWWEREVGATYNQPGTPEPEARDAG